MTTVYRIEHQDSGFGMYRNCASYDLYDIVRNCGGEFEEVATPEWHPAPEDDSKLVESGLFVENSSIQKYHFGFASIEQVRSWIYKDEWLECLHNAGYVLAIIETDKVYVGNTQAVFLRPEHYEKVSIKEYFNLKGE